MTSAKRSSHQRGSRISICRCPKQPGTATGTAAYDALQAMLWRRSLRRDGSGREAAGTSALDGAISDFVATLDGLRRQAGVPAWGVSAAVIVALCVGLATILGPTLFRAGPPCPVHPVVGHMTCGKLIPAGAQVVFHPVVGELPDQAVPRAVVRDDGSFALSTFGTDDGAPTGEYIVTIQWFRVGKDGSPGPNVLPRRYAFADSSPFRVAVAEGRNELTRFEVSR
jgi:hypothetical protein